jgi:hypothetical protein
MDRQFPGSPCLPFEMGNFSHCFLSFASTKREKKEWRKDLEETFFISHVQRLQFIVGISDSPVVTCEADKSIGIKNTKILLASYCICELHISLVGSE